MCAVITIRCQCSPKTTNKIPQLSSRIPCQCVSALEQRIRNTFWPSDISRLPLLHDAILYKKTATMGPAWSISDAGKNDRQHQ